MSKIQEIIKAGLRKAHIISQEHEKLPHEAELVQEIRCNDGISLLIRGYDSALGHGEDNFIRRYPILLKMPTPEKTKELIALTGAKPECVQPDGTILLDIIPGEVMIAAEHVEALEISLTADKIHLSPDADIFEIMMKDSEKVLNNKRHLHVPKDPPKFLAR